ncbi:hypothetical protein FWH09_00265 [Candidatus Saccharibacteria bacterium]|nr:hypothetical protein [Candidatus Saccharibacteria bacterium]
MSNYMDNNDNAEWKVSDEKVELHVPHGDHFHKPDLTNETLDRMYNETGKAFGEAHARQHNEAHNKNATPSDSEVTQ